VSFVPALLSPLHCCEVFAFVVRRGTEQVFVAWGNGVFVFQNNKAICDEHSSVKCSASASEASTAKGLGIRDESSAMLLRKM
jgi:hypothetical protein